MMPEKIWADVVCHEYLWSDTPHKDDTEYIRADVHEAEVARLKSALTGCLLGDNEGDCHAAEVVDLKAEVARLNKLLNQSEVEREDWKRWTHEREDTIEKLNKALKQMFQMIDNNTDLLLSCRTKDLVAVDIAKPADNPHEEYAPELADWLKENK